jgi:hypothetical protein
MNSHVESAVTESGQRSFSGGGAMKFNEKQLAVACAILWGASMLVMGIANMVWRGYGQDFLNVMASVYPGYHAAGSLLQVAIGTIYGFVDGVVGGFVFGWLYNHLT